MVKTCGPGVQEPNPSCSIITYIQSGIFPPKANLIGDGWNHHKEKSEPQNPSFRGLLAWDCGFRVGYGSEWNALIRWPCFTQFWNFDKQLLLTPNKWIGLKESDFLGLLLKLSFQTESNNSRSEPRVDGSPF